MITNSEEFAENVGEKCSNKKIFGEKFVENNKNICKMVINNKELELCSIFNKLDNLKEE